MSNVTPETGYFFFPISFLVRGNNICIAYFTNKPNIWRERIFMEERKRVRELGIKIGRFPTGQNNTITDIPGVKVGHETIITDGHDGQGPARTGVTVILPNDDIYNQRIFANSHVINGAGEMTGMVQMKEWGIIETPIALTNSMNVGIVSDGIIEYMTQRYPELGETEDIVLPIVAECDDSFLNNPRGRHVKQKHVISAIEKATNEEVEEGSIGSGTGMSCFEFKGGIGTSSRVIIEKYTIGTLVMTNFGKRKDFLLNGTPVGEQLHDFMPKSHVPEGSIIIVIGTDAPLLPHQLGRLAKRSALGLGKIGSKAYHGSGEISLAFSTGNRLNRGEKTEVMNLNMINDLLLNDLFEAAIECIEEAILNAMFKAKTVIGRNGNILYEIPIAKTMEILDTQ
jgi:D-aminopeptidase